MDRSNLLRILTQYFDMEEIGKLCFDLKINYGNIRGEDVPAKARELILYSERHSLLDGLIKEIKKARPNISLEEGGADIYDPSKERAKRLQFLRQQTSARDIAVLRVGSQAVTFPVTLSRNAIALAPVGERWEVEPNEQAEIRAQKLLSLGLLERRGSEVETSVLGRDLVAFDDLQRMS